MSRSRYALLINSLIHSLIKKNRDNFRVYLERAHPAFLTTLVVLVLPVMMTVSGSEIPRNPDCPEGRYSPVNGSWNGSPR